MIPITSTSVNPTAGPHVEATQTFAVSPHSSLLVTTAGGHVEIKGGDDGKIVVTTIRHAPTQAALASLDATVSLKDNALSATGTFASGCNNCGSVDFTITVPQDATIVAHADEGSISINGVDGTVKASTKHGPVLCGDLGGNAVIGTGDGMVNAGYRDLSHVTKIMLGAGAGTVRLVIPSDAKLGSINVGTGDGRLYTPWPLSVVQKKKGFEAKGTMSSTGPTVLMGTGKGDVVIATVPVTH
jgi:hypothetical protein